MKVTHQLSRLEPIVLDPLHGVNEEDWCRPRDAGWSLAQIVEHLAISIDVVASGFEKCSGGDCTERAGPATARATRGRSRRVCNSVGPRPS